MLIGLCGPAGAGKNTVAELLGFRQASFAAPLYRMVAAMTGMTVRELQDRDRKEKPIDWIGKSPRELLQTLGTEWGRGMVADDLWVKATMREVVWRLRYGENVAITDVRFPNEAQAVKDAGGLVVRVVRPGFECLAGGAGKHSSEAGIPDHLIDAEITNSGCLDGLRAAAEAVILKI